MTGEDKSKASEIVSLRFPQKPIRKSDATNLGACLKREVKQQDKNLKESLILEIDEDTKRTRVEHDPREKDHFKLGEEKSLPDKPTSGLYMGKIDL